MTEDRFWKIVETSKEASADDQDGQREALAKELRTLEPAGLVEFERIFQERLAETYRWDLWGAAYIINGGCSDDGFEYFRRWLISLGPDAYTQALDDPESLVDIDVEEGDAEFEEFGYVAREVYEEKAGQELPPPDIDFPDEPRGDSWEEDDLAELFPKLAEKYGTV